jgi:transcriptional regulator with XRE-family HTH domain
MIQDDVEMDDFTEGAATFGDRLALAREAQNLTQAQLATRLGLRTPTIVNWEADRSEPRANRLQMLAGFLNVSMVWLLTGAGAGAPATLTGEASASVALAALLDEIRDIRVANLRSNDRLAKLEKRLREVSAAA